MSLFIDRYSKKQARTVEVNLESILLRAQVIIDEAEGRHITNQAMLRQLSKLRDAMYQGYYVLDTFRYRAIKENKAEDHQVLNHSWNLSKFSYAKHLCLSSSSSSNSTETSQGLQAEDVLNSLRTMVLDFHESIMFLTTYPRLHRQPYNMHLLLEKCMFGRQMEMELVINFLLHTQPCINSLDRFDVLPIVGPGRSGKSTLVAHVCNDERVRDHFSQIAFFGNSNFRDEDIAILTDGCPIRHKQNKKLLIVFEVDGELSVDLWQCLCSLSKRLTASGSKIIITSRSDKITKLGTRQALILKPLPHEAYWYFFKVITFGSTNPEMHPRLAYLAMEIAKMLNGSLLAAHVISRLLGGNFNMNYWCKVLEFMRRSVAKHISMYGEHPCDLVDENKPTYMAMLGENSGEDLFISDTCSPQEEIPEITIQDVVYGGVKPDGIFKILAWKSQIPPYHCYIYTCEIRKSQARVFKRKRSLNNKCVSCG
ncbi:disease resistance protein RGA2-like [Brachypodium distachyon]|nr:disease resistance protein RGA2-like [Brachypodium distachyon]|eukprot:XP_003561289.2 disease resistance protein RGA2-like [Brachypodium distachyon]